MSEPIKCCLCKNSAMYYVINGKGEKEALCGNHTATNQTIEKFKNKSEEVKK